MNETLISSISALFLSNPLFLISHLPSLFSLPLTFPCHIRPKCCRYQRTRSSLGRSSGTDPDKHCISLFLLGFLWNIYLATSCSLIHFHHHLFLCLLRQWPINDSKSESGVSCKLIQLSWKYLFCSCLQNHQILN